MNRRDHPPLVALAAVLIAAGATAAARAEPEWYPLDPGVPPGTPPTIVLETGSNLDQTVLEVTLHGFFYENIVEQGQTFRRLSIDKRREEANNRVIGRPELPAAVHSVGSLVSVQPQPEPPLVEVIAEVTIPGALIYPFQPPVRDPEGDPPPPFQWDQAFYQQATTPYPATRGEAMGLLGRGNGIEILAFRTFPFRDVSPPR